MTDPSIRFFSPRTLCRRSGRFLAALSLGSLLLGSTAWAGNVLDRVLAVVNDEIILDTEVLQATEVEAKQALAGVERDSAEGQRRYDELRRRVLDSQIEKLLIAQYAREQKIYVTEDEMRSAIKDVVKNNNLSDESQLREALKAQGLTWDAYSSMLRQQLLQLKVVNTAVRSRVTVGDDEVRSYYAQTVRQVAGDQLQVRIHQIVVPVGKESPAQTVAERRAKAAKVVEGARAGQDFISLCQKFCDDPSKGDGDTGLVSRSELPVELREVVATMDPNDVRGPIRAERGFYIIRLVEKKDAEVRPFEEVKETLRRQLYEQQVDKAVTSWLKELRRKAHVDVRL
ncbi:MAG TPA: peptidyl-prolyl cis-trans isomerase [Pseudomonadota bacterium]|nr:peptidyl-prolyl cis-trans isomerase [Pseudomonadota bacterium]HNF99296.1 peptidyl-prolyl cis-trans isomerase [Pseudomonadota bacterium]HNI58622.1 peptidyl-prolyl cis-trans isomerase [Pseudomonadota bacterium]HNK45936.1 peptidyl-prolyl cis-trans isomerase [Pseudomonadota bacterium]HNN50440.1 peptidyl-prolyl cis-trans isomerase [Pseudomonadota bacterium]